MGIYRKVLFFNVNFPTETYIWDREGANAELKNKLHNYLYILQTELNHPTKKQQFTNHDKKTKRKLTYGVSFNNKQKKKLIVTTTDE